MIQSQLILDIFDLVLDDDSQAHLLQQQVPFLSEKKQDYSGAGVHIYFEHQAGIQDFKADPEDITGTSPAGDTFAMLDGVEIKHEENDLLASAMVHIENGLICSIEIWGKHGHYPPTEPTAYTLRQSWLPPQESRTITRG